MLPFYEQNMSNHDSQEKPGSLSPDEKDQMQSDCDKKTDELMDRVPDFIPADKIERGYDSDSILRYLRYDYSCLGHYKTLDYINAFCYTLFRKSFHPFFGEMEDRGSKIELLLRYLTHFVPDFFTVYKDRLTVRFDSGYYHTVYEETQDGVFFDEFYQESYHDGAGHGKRKIVFLHAPAVEIPAEVKNGNNVMELKLPQNSGFWQEDDNRFYVIAPLGMPGVFEMYIWDEYQHWHDSDVIIKEIGIAPDFHEKTYNTADDDMN